jgi:hypothetical protein
MPMGCPTQYLDPCCHHPRHGLRPWLLLARHVQVRRLVAFTYLAWLYVVSLLFLAIAIVGNVIAEDFRAAVSPSQSHE